jgi:hypothetical protein
VPPFFIGWQQRFGFNIIERSTTAAVACGRRIALPLKGLALNFARFGGGFPFADLGNPCFAFLMSRQNSHQARVNFIFAIFAALYRSCRGTPLGDRRRRW